MLCSLVEVMIPRFWNLGQKINWCNYLIRVLIFVLIVAYLFNIMFSCIKKSILKFDTNYKFGAWNFMRFASEGNMLKGSSFLGLLKWKQNLNIAINIIQKTTLNGMSMHLPQVSQSLQYQSSLTYKM